jgi:putative molybdopterin biosynthesis protein
MAGVSRQTIYAMEAGTYVPNTAVALRLARVFEVPVESLFTLADQSPALRLRSEHAWLLPGSSATSPGQPVQLCRVDRHLMAATPPAMPWYFPTSDAVVTNEPDDGGKTKVEIYHPDKDFRNCILVAGCDPGISVLARHLQPAGVELVPVHRNSSQALALLKKGCVHIAGTHLRDEASGESNIPAVGRLFRQSTVAVFTFAVWEEGIVTARGNPKGIKGIEDFARADIAMVNREKGAGSRNLLDSRLKQLKISAKNLRGYDSAAPGHLAAAWRVGSGAVDCCIATRAAARVYGLGFIPLESECYDLAIRRRHLDWPAIQALLDTLHRLSFRRELESIGGYDTKAAGQRML